MYCESMHCRTWEGCSYFLLSLCDHQAMSFMHFSVCLCEWGKKKFVIYTCAFLLAVFKNHFLSGCDWEPPTWKTIFAEPWYQQALFPELFFVSSFLLKATLFSTVKEKRDAYSACLCLMTFLALHFGFLPGKGRLSVAAVLTTLCNTVKLPMEGTP